MCVFKSVYEAAFLNDAWCVSVNMQLILEKKKSIYVHLSISLPKGLTLVSLITNRSSLTNMEDFLVEGYKLNLKNCWCVPQANKS